MRDEPELATAAVGLPAGVTPEGAEPDGGRLPELGRYVALEVLGEGGMGVVYRALDPELQRPVAAKVVRRELLGADGEARLLREARAMAQVTHPNVVTIFDVTPCDAGVVVAMELVEGTDLKQWMRGAERPWQDIVDTFLAAGRGLAAVHDAGLTHRDFKPANVLVADDGRVLVTDFGLALGTGGEGSAAPLSGALASSEASGGSGGSVSARATGSLDKLTRTGDVMGTPAYMAPEQRYGAAAQPSSDQYAFCIALWEGLCGRRPPQDPPYDRTPGALVPPWPNPPGVPRAFGGVLRRGLSTEPEGRYASMADLLTALQAAHAPRRRWWGAAGVAAFIGVGASALIASDPHPDPCASDPLAEVWWSEPRDAVVRAFAEAGSPIARESIDHVTRELDAYAETHAELYAEVCRSEADPEGRDLQLACLAGRRRALAGTVELLTAADPSTVRSALELTRRLPALGACTDAASLKGTTAPPSDPAIAAAVEGIDGTCERVDALTVAGQYDEAKLLAEHLPERAEPLGYAPIHARALFARGALWGATSRPEDGVVDLRHAVEVAAAAGDDRTASLAASRTAFLLAWDLGRVDEGLVAARQGLAHAERIDPDGGLAAAAHAMLATVLSARGDLDEATEHGERAERWFDEHGQTFSADGVRTHLARTLIRRGDLRRAVELMERVATSRRETLPPSHIEIANAISNLAAARAQSGDFEAAEPLMREGYERRLAALGPDHMATIDSLANLGHVHAELGRREQSEREHRESLEAYERLLGPEHPRVANALDALATDLDERGDYEGAITLQRRALDILVGLHGPDHPSLALHHNNLANTLERAGHTEETARHRARVEALTTAEERALLGW